MNKYIFYTLLFSGPLIVVFDCIFLATYNFITRKKYENLCKTVADEFGFVPFCPYLINYMFPFFPKIKGYFFILILTHKRGSIYLKAGLTWIEDEHYDFVRSLPKEMTGFIVIPYIVRITCSIIALAMMLVSLQISKLYSL